MKFVTAIVVSIALLAASAYAVHATGTTEPFTHKMTFENDTPFPADALLVELSDYQWQIDMVGQPGRCPIADIDTGGGFEANATWGQLCVRPGESITLLMHGECDECQPPDTTVTWTHNDLGDSNCGGTTDPIDATLDLQLVAALIDTVPCEMNADFNGDGAITVIDATLTLQLSAGLFSV
jgi:hypothetical protein